MSLPQLEPASAKAFDLLQEHRQVYDDLLAVLAGRAPLPLTLRSVDESRALAKRLLDCWRIMPAQPAAFYEETLETILRPDDFQRVRNAWIALTAFAKAQVVGVFGLTDRFERHGLHYSLLKGAAASFRLYQEPHSRTSGDFDLAVARRDLGVAEELACEVGFRPAQKNEQEDAFEPADPKVRAAVEAQHYELGFMVRRLQVTNLSAQTLDAIRATSAEPWTFQFWLDVDSRAPWCYSIVDIHHALSLDIGAEDLLATTQRVQVGRRTVSIPGDAWLAAHLVFKIYWEGVHSYGKGLYQFADMVRMVPLLGVETFEALLTILERHGMIAGAHYVFRRLPAFGVTLPDHVQAFVQDTYRPPQGGEPTRLNDLGDMWPRLWGQR